MNKLNERQILSEEGKNKIKTSLKKKENIFMKNVFWEQFLSYTNSTFRATLLHSLF